MDENFENQVAVETGFPRNEISWGEDEQQSGADVRGQADVAQRSLRGRDDGQERVVDAQEGVDQEVDNEDGAAHEEGGEPEVAERVRVKQSHEDNAAARAARIRAERDTEEALRRQYDEKISGLGLINPYTGKPFSGFADFESYSAQYQKDLDRDEAKKQGKTPEQIAEEREDRLYIQRKRREEAETAQARKEGEKWAQFMRDDLSMFVDKHPDVDISKLEGNPKFRKFAGKRLYNEPLTELYDDFVELVGETERAATVKAASKQQRSTGSGGGGESVGLTPAQERALESWNRENPHMKMTPKEFVGR